LSTFDIQMPSHFTIVNDIFKLVDNHFKYKLTSIGSLEVSTQRYISGYTISKITLVT
jgi:hypothetical protein